MNECQVGFQPMGRICTPCPNGVCVGRRSELLDITTSVNSSFSVQFVEV